MDETARRRLAGVIARASRASENPYEMTARRRCACRKCHPCRLSGVLVLMKDAAEAIASADVEVGRGGRAFAIP